MPTSSSDDNPLPRCPDAPNCVRTTRVFDVTPGALFQAAQRALTDLGPAELHAEPNDRRADAVYRVAFIFKDDVQIAVTARDGGSALHIRSESRVGYEDLGVNRRRVKRFFRALDRRL